MKITLSKTQWDKIGEVAGWQKTAMRDVFEMYVSFEDEMIFENKSDIFHNVDYNKLNPKNIWVISYNNSTFRDGQLFSQMNDRYMNGEYGKRGSDKSLLYTQFFLAADVSAINYYSGNKISVDELVRLIESTCGISRFFDFIKENETFYKIYGLGEEIESKVTDNQLPGQYEEYGVDKTSI